MLLDGLMGQLVVESLDYKSQITFEWSFLVSFLLSVIFEFIGLIGFTDFNESSAGENIRTIEYDQPLGNIGIRSCRTNRSLV